MLKGLKDKHWRSTVLADREPTGKVVLALQCFERTNCASLLICVRKHQKLNFLLSYVLALLQFDPTLHLAYEAPLRSYTLTELGLDPSDRKNKSNAIAVKDFAYTEPFRLLSAAGVEARITALSQSCSK